MWRITDTPDGNAFTHEHHVPAHLLASIQDEDMRARIVGSSIPPDYSETRDVHRAYRRALAAVEAAKVDLEVIEADLDIAIYLQWSSGADLWPIGRALGISRQQVRTRSKRGAQLLVERDTLNAE